MLEAVATQMQFSEFPKKLETVKGMVLDEMSKDKDRLVSSITATKVEQRLKKPRNFDSKVVGKLQLRAAMTDLTTSIDVEAMYDQTEAHVDRVLVDRDYEEALRLYNNKGLLGKIEPQFGLAHKGMVDLIKRLASSKEGVDMTLALKQQLPDPATH